MEITFGYYKSMETIRVWVLINWLVNVGKTFTFIFKHYVLQIYAVKCVKCMVWSAGLGEYLHKYVGNVRNWVLSSYNFQKDQIMLESSNYE